MNKRSIVSLIVAIAMILSIIVIPIYAEDAPTITVDSATAVPGGEVKINISVSNNPGIASLKLFVSYDEALTLTKIEYNSVIGGISQQPQDPNNIPNPAILNWYNGVANSTGDWVFATLTFIVSENATDKDCEITVSYDEDDVYDISETNIAFDVVNGKITIECSHVNTQNTPETPADCDESGYTAGVWCNDCETYISGHEEIPATGDHVDADGKWETDAENHYHTCGCGEKFDIAKHSGGSANCTDKAVCETCGAEYGEADSTKHGETEIRDASEATCSKDGYTGDTYCRDCGEKIATGSVIPATGEHADADGKWETDADNHYHTCACGEIIDTAAHSGGSANCTDKAVCETCGAEYGEVDSTKHGETEVRDASEATCSKDGYTGDTYCKDCGEKTATGTVIPATGEHVDADGKWETDAENHYHTCACGEIIDTAAHSGGSANCTDKAVCETCGTEYGEADSTKHGETEIRDASEATCSKDGYTGDTYCKDCGEKIATGTVIPATGNHVDADGKWETDAENHYHTCACGEIIDTAAHSGGSANCTDKAVCETCGTEYGEADSTKHGETEVRDAFEATCAKDGYTGDTYCKDCGEKTATGTVIPATGEHVDADGKWETDAENHYHTCACGEIIDTAAHSGGSANCTDKAVCETCGTEYGEVDSTKHGETEIRDASEATCSKDGYTGDTYCKDCGEKIATGTVIPATGNHADADGKWETDADNHFHTCACGAKFDTAAHTGGSANCTDKAVCEICGTEYGEADSTKHGETEIRDASEATCSKDGYTGDTYCKDCGEKIATGTVIPATGNHVDADGKWECDDAYHYHVCGCGEKFDIDEHTGGTANCTDKAVCEICGTEYGEADSTKHGETEVRDAFEATCAKDGYTGDTYCKDCGEKIATGSVIPATGNHADADGKWETDADNHYHTCGCGEIVDSEAHTYGDWVTTKEPTVDSEGVREKTCTVCEHTVTEDIPKLEETPETGDSTIFIIFVALIAITGVGIAVVSYKKKNYTH